MKTIVKEVPADESTYVIYYTVRSLYEHYTYQNEISEEFKEVILEFLSKAAKQLEKDYLPGDIVDSQFIDKITFEDK